ncbi:hypothetical protein [Dietzia alimentaria]|uniref:hypothetical protein n=1 Tax=Dietzia alimentaria TaxID=665550 RepID=UPI001EE63E56|nr:hypothetical protein [Dietzia alimentaria]
MIITENACAIKFPVGAASLNEPGPSDDKRILGLKALVGAVHAVGLMGSRRRPSRR